MADWSQYAEEAGPTKTDWSQYSEQPTVAPVSTGEAVGRGAVQGATLGLAPKISAAGRAYIVNPVEDALHAVGIGPGSTGQTYSQMRDEYNQANAAAASQHPLGYLGGAVVGGAPAAMATGGRVVPLAAEGAVNGAGRTADTPAEFATNVATGAGVNTVLGGVGAAVGKVASTAGENLATLVQRAYKLPTLQAAKDAIKSGLGVGGEQGLGRVSTLTPAVQTGLNAVKQAAGTAALGAGGAYVGGLVADLTGADPTLAKGIGAAALGLPGAAKYVTKSGGAAGLFEANPALTAARGLTKGKEGLTGPMQSLGLLDVRNPGTVGPVVGTALGAGGNAAQQMVPDNRSRLQVLADDARARFGF